MPDDKTLIIPGLDTWAGSDFFCPKCGTTCYIKSAPGFEDEPKTCFTCSTTLVAVSAPEGKA